MFLNALQKWITKVKHQYSKVVLKYCDYYANYVHTVFN